MARSNVGISLSRRVAWICESYTHLINIYAVKSLTYSLPYFLQRPLFVSFANDPSAAPSASESLSAERTHGRLDEWRLDAIFQNVESRTDEESTMEHVCALFRQEWSCKNVEILVIVPDKAPRKDEALDRYRSRYRHGSRKVPYSSSRYAAPLFHRQDRQVALRLMVPLLKQTDVALVRSECEGTSTEEPEVFTDKEIVELILEFSTNRSRLRSLVTRISRDVPQSGNAARARASAPTDRKEKPSVEVPAGGAANMLPAARRHPRDRAGGGRLRPCLAQNHPDDIYKDALARHKLRHPEMPFKPTSLTPLSGASMSTLLKNIQVCLSLYPLPGREASKSACVCPR